MAIVKMKRLRLLAMRQDREALLRALQDLGCVEVEQPELDLSGPEREALARPDAQALSAAKERGSLLRGALTILKKYDRPKGGLLTPRPEVSLEQLFDDGAYADGLACAQSIVDGERQAAALVAQVGKLKAQKASLAPWLSLDVPLDTQGDGTVDILFGTVPASVDFQALEGVAQAATPLCALYYAGRDRELHYFLLVCHTSGQAQCLEALREYGFSRASLRGWTGTAADNDRALDEEIARVEQDLARLRQSLADRGAQREGLQRSLDRCTQEIAREEAKTRLLDTRDTFLLEGWVPEEDTPRLEQMLGAFPCAWELADPAPEEYAKVPVRLKNGPLTRCMNMVTNMYALPVYGTVDPNPLMAPFFILFYGIMMADMGYGLLMVLGALFILKKLRPREGMRNFAELLLLCGICTFVVGALTGGFFGDFLPKLVAIIDPDTTFTALPALFTPLEDTMAILVGSLVLGFIQIVTGQAVSFVKKIRDGHAWDAMWDEFPWWVIYLGVGLFVLGVGNVAGYPVVLIIGILLMMYGSSRNAKGFGKAGAVVGAVYNGVTGIFGDVLSYARLMALMLSGSIIASVFNTLGGITGNVIAFVIIAMVGNALNFALNLLGCYVHDLRLQCLEFFKTFYQDGGAPFRPLRIDTKYVDIEEEEHHVG